MRKIEIADEDFTSRDVALEFLSLDLKSSEENIFLLREKLFQ